MKLNTMLGLAMFAMVLAPVTANAKTSNSIGEISVQPRVVPGAPGGSVARRAIVGMAVGQAVGTATNTLCECGAGMVTKRIATPVAKNAYDTIHSPKYYAPKALGTQTTTPYMLGKPGY